MSLTRQTIDKLDREEKWVIFLHYLLVQLSLKYRFHVRDIIDNTDNHGFGNPDKVVGKLEFRYLWKDLKPLSFDEFIVVKDNMCVPDYLPLWEWYCRFKDEIEFKQMDYQNR